MHYAISKYDPAYRIDGIYTKEEWTDYSDIGRIVGDHLLTKSEYLTVENRYLSTVSDVLDLLGIDQMELQHPEMHGSMRWLRRVLKLYPRTKDRAGILSFLRGCLRNKYWGELHHPALTIFTGYDYYLAIICDLPEETIERIVSKNRLYYQASSDADIAEREAIDHIGTQICLASKDETHPTFEDALSEDEINALISKVPDPNKKDHGEPLLNIAVKSQLESVARYLLERGVDVNARDVFDGRTALHVAAEAGSVPFIQLLLSYGADADARDKSGNTPLMLADPNAHPDLAALLNAKP